MAIYRGPGGSGDATGDAANEAQLAQEYAANAATSATNASNSATAAASSASAASTSESNASTSASAASSSASAASTSATNASNSATAAASSASAASTSASNAAASESAAAASEAAAGTSETNAAASEAAAATSETNAAASEAAAATSETNAAASEAAAATSESNAATSETNAASSASAASTSASNASTSATNAANSASAAATSESNAATSESNAATSESNAATSETNAANSASAAATSASNASTSETNAAASASAAATSAANAAASYDSFDDRYLGTKASDPALDNDGNALVTGALYYNTTDGEMRVYDGSQWLAASAASQAILVVYSYTATAAQTTFTGADDNAVTLSYTQGSIIVTLNGVVLEDGTDYTATNGTSVVLTTGAALNDEVNIHAFTTFDVANVYTQAQSDARYLQLSGGTLTGTLNATALNTSGAVVFNDAGADVDFRVEGDTDANLLFVDAGNDRVGVGTNAPGDKFQVAGNALFGTGSSAVTIGGATATAGGATDKNLTLSAWSSTSGVNEYGGNLTLAAGRPIGNGSGVTGSVIIKVGKEGVDNSTAGSVVDAITADIATLTFKTNETERMRINSSGNVGIGTSSPATKFNVSDSSTNCALTVTNSSSNFQVQSNSNDGYVNLNGSGNIIFRNGTPSVTERMRLTSGGSLVVGNTTDGIDSNGQKFRSDGQTFLVVTDATPLTLNRYTTDGTLIEFRQDNSVEGSISVSGGTVSYNPFLGSHSGALADWSKPEIKIGTVMDTIDELLEYKVVVIDVQEEVPAKEAVLDEEGNEVEPAQEATTQTVQKRITYNGNGAVGSSATVEYEGEEYTGTIQHEREEPLSFNKHLKVKVNDTAASKAVFGVFVGWNNDKNNDGGVYNDMLVGAVGNYVIRMAAGQEPQVGDLVEADGNGCAVVQDDDIIRTKTIAKVTSTIKQVTYDDGSFLVTCVLYCG
jgi:hypothetical protein